MSMKRNEKKGRFLEENTIQEESYENYKREKYENWKRRKKSNKQEKRERDYEEYWN